MQRISLAQQIAELDDVAPADIDPEDALVKGVNSDDDVSDDRRVARAHYVDVGPSLLRKAHDSIADPKYEGVGISRKALMEGQSDTGDSEGEEGGDDDNLYSQLEDKENEVDERDTHGLDGYDHEPPRSEDRVEPSEHEEGLPTEDSRNPPTSGTHNSDLSSNLRQTREDDRRKGKAISRQIALWDSLLDSRIRLQKTVSSGNRLPSFSHYANSEQVQGVLANMLEQAQLLSDELFSFQQALLTSNEGIQLPPRKRRKRDAEPSVSDYADEFQEATSDLSLLQHTYHPHLVQTLNKWSTKIQAVAPSVLLPSNRNAFSKSTQHLKTAAQLIDETLADHDEVLARTRVYRGKDKRSGVQLQESEKEDATLFDDTDFYQQLLRDVIDSRSGSGGDDDWMAVQKAQKSKKQVDTKASKGRKLRYQVHEKLQNFMVPIAMHNGWHDEQVDELFASLLGKGFENAMREVGEVVSHDMESSQQQVDVALTEGFRVFG